MMIGDIAVVRGGGDIATGVVQKLHRTGFRVLVLEIEKPTSIRRTVCFSEAIYNGKITIENMESVFAKDERAVKNAWAQDLIPVVIDPKGYFINIFKPLIVVDASIEKRNTGMTRNLAPITVAVGPGFIAGKDADVVIESNRGHNLGK
ncbi:MAG: molybdenum hydroxylase, partial [Sedimentibacter sp.]